MSGGGTGSKGSSCSDGVDARRGDEVFLYRESGDIGDSSSSRTVRSYVICPFADGVMGDA